MHWTRLQGGTRLKPGEDKQTARMCSRLFGLSTRCRVSKPVELTHFLQKQTAREHYPIIISSPVPQPQGKTTMRACLNWRRADARTEAGWQAPRLQTITGDSLGQQITGTKCVHLHQSRPSLSLLVGLLVGSGFKSFWWVDTFEC